MPELKQLPLRIGEELDAVAVRCDSAQLVFLASKAFPPGQPMHLTLFPNSDRALPLQARSLGSRVQTDQRYEVRTRLVNLSREARRRLESAFDS